LGKRIEKWKGVKLKEKICRVIVLKVEAAQEVQMREN